MLKTYILLAGVFALLIIPDTTAQSSGAKPGIHGQPSDSQMRGGAPTNDECSTAIPLTVGETCTAIVGTNENATQSLPPSDDCSAFVPEQANDVWFSFVAIGTSTTVDLTGTMSYDAILEVFEGTCSALVPLGCSDDNFPSDPPTLDMTETFVAATTPGETYYVRAYYYNYDDGTGIVYPDDFTFSICAYESPDAPPNDLCEDAIDQALAIGSTITMSGNNIGATEEPAVGDILVWHSFTTTECADVKLNYWVDGPAFQMFYLVVITDCADFMNSFIWGSYTDSSVTYYQLPAGTYKVPVLVDAATTPIGDYTIEASATVCDTYCAAFSAGCDEFASNVNIGNIDNASDCGSMYQNFTDLSTVLSIGMDHGITVNNNPNSYFLGDQCTVWVDWNQDLDLEDAGEAFTLTSDDDALTFTGNIVPPADAILGATRMRVRLQYSEEPLPCGRADYGDVEDYTVVVQNGSSISEGAAGDWSIFPNPSNGNITISGSQLNGAVNVELRDMTGRVVYSTSLNTSEGQDVTLALSGVLASGNYHLNLMSASGRTVRSVMVR